MSDINREDDPSKIDRFAPKRFRERTPIAERPYITSSPLAAWNQELNALDERKMRHERQTTAEPDSSPERFPEHPVPLENRMSSPVFLRVCLVAIFAAVVAVGVIFAKPIAQGVFAWFDLAQPSKSAERPTTNPAANNAPVNEPVVPKTRVAAASVVVPTIVAQPP